MLRRILAVLWLLLILYVFQSEKIFAQDAATGAIRATVQDRTGARIAMASVVITDQSTGIRRGTLTDDQGILKARLLPPGTYAITIKASGMAALETKGILVELGSEVELNFTLKVAGSSETVSVSAIAAEAATQAAGIAEVIDQNAITSLPLNGRRFSDLALLVSGVVVDPRGQTSSSVGDISSGGIRGFQTSYLVDGGDNNNSFFAQARGRYRAPYQFSNEVVQEFRVNK